MKKPIIFLTLLGMTALACSLSDALVLPSDVSYIEADGAVPQRIQLDQDWTDEVREKFWFTSQGSQIMPYSWFTWLEQPDNDELFRSSQHMEMLGYLPMKTSRDNPSGLPIGFAMTKEKSAKDAYMGLTCAACHTNQLNYKGSKLLIDGAPTLANFVLFYDRLVDALNTTVNDPVKFERFASRVLQGRYNNSSVRQLKDDLLEVAIKSGQRRDVNVLPQGYPSDFTSFGRLDAFGNIENAGSAIALGDLTNRNFPTAPVSYPFLWGTHQSDVVQWNASAPNIPVVGPIIRNVGEVVGVFGGLEIKKASWIKRLFGIDHVYNSTVDFHGLGALEGYVKILRSPQWPENVLPPIDRELSERGRQIFEDAHCSSCHKVVLRDQEDEHYISSKISVAKVGTDPETAWQINNHMAKSLILEGYKSDIISGDVFESETRALDISLNGVIGLALKNPVKALEAGIITTEEGDPKNWKEYVKMHQEKSDSIQQESKARAVAEMNQATTEEETKYAGLVYKARPLNGIWATAPYLHNGSVPNLNELLKAPKDRMTSFWVGSREFDPVNVGFETNKGKSEFKVNQSHGNVIMPGNSNRGHAYGTNLRSEDKKALIEYLKTI